jgi:hypothetical protein
LRPTRLPGCRPAALCNGEAVDIFPKEFEHRAKCDVRFDDGSTAVLAGDQMTDKKIASMRAWNGASEPITAKYFTWVKVGK